MYECNYVHWKAVGFCDKHYYELEFLKRFSYIEKYFKCDENIKKFCTQLENNTSSSNQVVIDEIIEYFEKDKEIKNLNLKTGKWQFTWLLRILLGKLTGVLLFPSTNSHYFTQTLNSPSDIFLITDYIRESRNDHSHGGYEQRKYPEDGIFNVYTLIRELHMLLMFFELNVAGKYSSQPGLIKFNIEKGKFEKQIDRHMQLFYMKNCGMTYEDAFMRVLEESKSDSNNL